MTAATYHALSQRLRTHGMHAEKRGAVTTPPLLDDAADAIDTLVARVEQLEACLADTCRQLEVGGAK